LAGPCGCCLRSEVLGSDALTDGKVRKPGPGTNRKDKSEIDETFSGGRKKGRGSEASALIAKGPRTAIALTFRVTPHWRQT
jgi:hypothetical protein